MSLGPGRFEPQNSYDLCNTKCFLNYQKAFFLNIFRLLNHSKCYGPKGRKKQGTWCESNLMSGTQKPMSASVQEQDEKSSRIKQQSEIKSKKIKRQNRGICIHSIKLLTVFIFIQYGSW